MAHQSTDIALDLLGKLSPEAMDIITMPARTMGGGNPLDFDKSLVIYLVLFLAVFFILKPLLFDPYLKVREARQAGIGGSRDEAQALQAQAEEKLKAYEEGLKVARQEAAERREALKREGQGKEEELLKAAADKAEAKLKEHRAKMATQVEEARGQLKDQAGKLAGAITDQLLPSA